MNKRVGLFIPTRLTNKIFLHTSTKCVRPSETFRTSYQIFSIVVLKKNNQCRTNNQVHVSLLTSNRQRNEQLGQRSNLKNCQTELVPAQTFLFRIFEGPRRAFDASRLVLDLVACLSSIPELPKQIFAR
jgi:hypothetical protein